MTSRTLRIFISLSGLSGVIFGAFGAHALKAKLAPDSFSAWQTAVLYQFIHTLALLALNAWHSSSLSSSLRGWIAAAAWGWATGIILFSGSLYGLALGAPKWLGPLTPFGGLAFMIGWAALAIDALKKSAATPQSSEHDSHD